MEMITVPMLVTMVAKLQCTSSHLFVTIAITITIQKRLVVVRTYYLQLRADNGGMVDDGRQW